MVGGVADWFAVTALFRRPLGLPIPHTAIIPAQKERLGQGLGRFVANHVFTEAEVARVLGRLDLAGIIRSFLADPETARPAAQALAASLPRLLASLEDGRARRLLGRLLPRLAGGAGGARVVARALRSLVEGGRHQEVVDLAITELRRLLVEKEDQLRQTIEAKVREEGGRLVGWALGATVAGRVLAGVNAELARMEAADSDLRKAFELWLKTEVERLETDPERAAALGRAMRQGDGAPLGRRLGERCLGPAAGGAGGRCGQPRGPHGGAAGRRLRQCRHHAGRGPGGAGTAEPCRAAGAGAADAGGAGAARGLHRQGGRGLGHRAGDREDRAAGRRDLQYVRMNGTLVGFLVGGALYALLTAVFGRVAF